MKAERVITIGLLLLLAGLMPVQSTVSGFGEMSGAAIGANGLESVAAAQRSVKERYRRVGLTKEARKNGYTVIKRDSEYFLRCEGVEDPVTKKLLEGKYQVEAQCPKLAGLLLNMQFSRGKGEAQVDKCTLFIFVAVLVPMPDDN